MQQPPINSPSQEGTRPASSPDWICGERRIALDQPLVMGILNVTPDSFSDGGRYVNVEQAMRHALEMVSEGADILDVGGESTRPGAALVEEDEELRRVIPVLQALSKAVDIPLSVDTRHSRVAREAVQAGACIINDVACFTGDLLMARVVRETRAGLVITHNRGTPQDMLSRATYEDVVATVEAELGEALAFAGAQGIERAACVLDPGIGFAKHTQHNLQVLAALERLTGLGPLLVGTSRKRFIGEVCKVQQPDQRLGGSLAAAVWSVLHGARLVRVHDVKETKEGLTLIQALRTINP